MTENANRTLAADYPQRTKQRNFAHVVRAMPDLRCACNRHLRQVDGTAATKTTTISPQYGEL